MTVPCTSCGEILDLGADRCRYCGTLAPPEPGTSVFAHETNEPRWADEPTLAQRSGGDGAADPLTIPIRGPAPARRPADDHNGLPRAVPVAVVVLAALALVAVVAAQLLGGGDGDDLAGEEQPPATQATAADRPDSEVASVSTSGPSPTTSSSTTTSTSTTSTTTTPTTSTTAAPTTTRATATRPGSVPVLAESFRSGWVAQLSSVPTSAGTAAVESAYERIRSDAPGAVAARSDEWPSMAPGYWVLVEPGPFGSEGEVEAFCSSIERSGDDCLPRLLADRR